MKKPIIGAAWRNALQVWKSQFGAMLMFTLFQLILRLIALCPLLFLAVGQPSWISYITNPVGLLSKEPWRWLFLLSPVLYVLLILPARQSAANVMQDALGGESIFSVRMIFGGASYGQKLLRGLKNTGVLLLWSLPLLVLLGWTSRQFGGTEAGQTDGLSQMIRLMDFGGGDIVRGVIYAFLVLVATMIPLMFGCALHSGRRHEWALGDTRLVTGHRGSVLLAWFSALLVYLPFLLIVLVFTGNYLMEALENFKNSFALSLPAADWRVWITILAVVALLIPAIPLKRMVTAALVRQLQEEKA